MPEPEDHNSGRYLRVIYSDNSLFPRQKSEAGWYVVRICPCHWREPVTLALRSKVQAENARRLMIAMSEKFYTTSGRSA